MIALNIVSRKCCLAECHWRASSLASVLGSFGFDFKDTSGSKRRTRNRVHVTEIQSSKITRSGPRPRPNSEELTTESAKLRESSLERVLLRFHRTDHDQSSPSFQTIGNDSCVVTAKTSGATACPSAGKQCSSMAVKIAGIE